MSNEREPRYTSTRPPLDEATVELMRLASREPAPHVTEICDAQGLNLDRLSFVKWLLANGRFRA